MKKVMAVAIILLTSSVFNVTAYADSQEDFLTDLSTALAERWSYNDDINTMSTGELAEYYTKIVDTEYDCLSKYDQQSFDNEKFDKMAHAYIDALEAQKDALNYIIDIPDVYNVLWTAGYNSRAALVPDFVDYYGLKIDDADSLQEMRDVKNSLYTYTVTSTVSDTGTDTSTDDAATSMDDVNMGDTVVQEPIEIYNDDGVKVTITKYDKTNYGTAKLLMDVVNLYHKDLSFSSNNGITTINGTSYNLSAYGEVQSGKTGTVTLEIYPEQVNGLEIDDITSIDFQLAIYSGNFQSLKTTTEDIYLTVNGNIVTSRIVYTDQENIKKVQQLLAALGYDTGSTDGIPGKLTNNSILQFERDHGMAENTDITPELIAALENAANQ